jgi:hypothetical protein
MHFLKRSGWLFFFVASTLFLWGTDLFDLRTVVLDRFEGTWGWLGNFIMGLHLLHATELGLFAVRIKRTFDSDEAVRQFSWGSSLFELSLAYISLFLCLSLTAYWPDPIIALFLEAGILVGLGYFLSIFKGKGQ